MLPAYGRELLELRRDGRRPAKPVYVVADWPIAKELRALDRFALVAELPRAANFFTILERRRFDFAVLHDLVVVLIPDWVDWLAHIEPQVRAARPRELLRAISFSPDVETPLEKVRRTMEGAEPDLVLGREREQARARADYEAIRARRERLLRETA